MKNNIYLYTDYFHNNGVLHRRLVEHFGVDNVGFCDADDILSDLLERDDPKTSIFVMPGGADLYFCERLNGTGNQKIKDFVSNGGRYLGICAGAYYGCASLGFAEDLAGQSISGPRELGFYNGKAIGPIFDYIQDQDFEKSWDGIATIDYQGQVLKCLYRGGPFFQGDIDDDMCLARYTDIVDTPPAVIEVPFGQGKAILCGPHLEVRSDEYRKVLYRHRNENHDYEDALVDALKEHDVHIDHVWSDMLKRLSS